MALKLDANTGKWVEEEDIPSQSPANAPSSAELEKLEGYSREELIAIIKRMARQCGTIACHTDDETFQAGMDRLASLFLHKLPDSEAKEISTVFDRWADRTKGKPAMQINQNTTVTLVDLVRASYAKPCAALNGGVSAQAPLLIENS